MKQLRIVTLGRWSRVLVASPCLWLAVACGDSGSGPARSEVPDGGGVTSNGGAAATGSGGAAGGVSPGSGGTTGSGGGGGAAAGSGGASTSSGGASQGSGGNGAGGATSQGTSTTVHLVPAAGVSGLERINFALPLAPGQLTDARRVVLFGGAAELPAGRRALATHPDGSIRSVQIQLDLVTSGESDIEVRVGEVPATAELSLVPVESTLVAADGESGPRVWALLPAEWLSSSGVAGPLLPAADDTGSPAAAWTDLCDYDRFGVDGFLASGYESDRAVWLFDRGTALYRGYARRGDLGTLRSAYVETSMYRNRITGSGTSARNGVPPDASDDVKYTYAQNLALHYLLTGDDRHRESAEDMALGMSALWPDPGYAGGPDFWTERHAGFGLLAYVWAMIVSDDRSPAFRKLADDAVAAYLSMQATYPPGHADTEARCFAHTADAHGESGAYFGCSPWMSAILGDGLEQYATESDTARAASARASLVKLGRIIARDGIQPDGRPYYFMGVGTTESMLEEYDEHFGESAYLVAMAWFYSGRTDGGLRTTADALVGRLGSDGTAPHVRSFNWQCRSAVAASWFLR